MRAHRFLLTVAALLPGGVVADPTLAVAQTPALSDPALDVPTGRDPTLDVPLDWTAPSGALIQPRVPPTPLPPQLITAPPMFTAIASPADYPPESLRLGEQGIIRSRFLVTETGETAGCSIEATSDYARLDEAACALVAGWKFKPGANALPVTVNLIFEVPTPPTIPPGDPILNVPDRGPAPQQREAPPALGRFTPVQSVTSHAVTVDDYPADSIRMQEQGTIRLVFLINEAGNVPECIVDMSSGYPRLDAAACAMVVRRWKYKPATLDGRATAIIATANVVYQLR